MEVKNKRRYEGVKTGIFADSPLLWPLLSSTQSSARFKGRAARKQQEPSELH